MSGQSGADEKLLADRYLLVERLGHGPTGVVWRARDQAAGRDVAVKELTVTGLPPEELPALYSRMEEGIRAAARLRNPGVVTVLDLLAHDGHPWIVMELIDGRSLADTLAAQGALPPRDAARLGLPVLDALEEAHGHGVLHRGVKAANVLLGHGGRVALTDFGVTALEGAADLVRTAEALGAPDHLAPERIAGRAPGPESDVWSTGVMLYAAVEGLSPFRRATTEATLQAVAAEPLPRPGHAGPLAPALEAMLSKDPTRRTSVGQARRMLGEVTSVAAGRPGGEPTTVPVRPTPTVTAAPPGVGRPPPPPRTRKPRVRALITAASVALALIGGGIAVAKMLSGSHQPARPPAVTQNAPPPPASPPPPPPSAPPSAPSSPGQVVEDYYAAINAHDYRRAWTLGGRNLDGSYDSYAAGFAKTASVALTVTSVSGDTVTMRLDTRQTDGSQRHFAGTYTVRNGEIVSADVRGG